VFFTDVIMLRPPTSSCRRHRWRCSGSKCSTNQLSNQSETLIHHYLSKCNAAHWPVRRCTALQRPRFWSNSALSFFTAMPHTQRYC